MRRSASSFPCRRPTRRPLPAARCSGTRSGPTRCSRCCATATRSTTRRPVRTASPAADERASTARSWTDHPVPAVRITRRGRRRWPRTTTTVTSTSPRDQRTGGSVSDAADPSVEGLTRRDLHGGPRRTWRTWAVVAVVTVLVLVVGGTAYAAWRLNANITKLDVSAAIGTDRPTQAPGAAEAVNILLIGSDTREGAGNDAYADRDGTLGGGAHSDTNLLVHLSADRTSATVVSIPRDSMTLAPPNCSATAPKSDWTMRQWNQNYAIGGTGCLIRTLEGNT